MAVRAAALIESVSPRSLALSGGRSPRETYRVLASSAMDWAQVDLLQVDERVVDRKDPRSNWRMIEETLASRVGAHSHPMPVRDGPDRCAELYEQVVQRFQPLDLVVLGLGSDGHTASLFPASPLLESERLVAADTARDPARLSMTFPCINSARVAVFIVSGEEKSDALAALMGDSDIPAARVDAAEGVYVLADDAAAFAVRG